MTDGARKWVSILAVGIFALAAAQSYSSYQVISLARKGAQAHAYNCRQYVQEKRAYAQTVVYLKHPKKLVQVGLTDNKGTLALLRRGQRQRLIDIKLGKSLHC